MRYTPSKIDGYRGRFPMRACRRFVWFILAAFAAALIGAPLLAALFHPNYFP